MKININKKKVMTILGSSAIMGTYIAGVLTWANNNAPTYDEIKDEYAIIKEDSEEKYFILKKEDIDAYPSYDVAEYILGPAKSEYTIVKEEGINRFILLKNEDIVEYPSYDEAWSGLDYKVNRRMENRFSANAIFGIGIFAGGTMLLTLAGPVLFEKNVQKRIEEERQEEKVKVK